MTLTLIYLLFIPLGIMMLSRRWDWINKVSPMVLLYIIGLIVGNCGIMTESSTNACNLLSTLTIPLAIPLMLMGCSLKGFSLRKAFRVFASGLLSVLIVTVAGFYIFRSDGLSYENQAQVCATMIGIYTGGIPNIGAIAQGVKLPNHLYLIVTSGDLIITSLYLLFIIFLGKPLFRWLLPENRKELRKHYKKEESKEPPPQVWQWGSMLLVGATLVIAGISYAVSLIPSHGAEVNMTILILLLTTLAIGASFIPPIQRQRQSFDMGLYCVYVFCLSIATQVNISELNLIENLSIIYYIAFAIFGSVVLQILFAKLLKLDGDSVMVCSIALINSPPFVPMVAALLKNKNVVVLGISIGLLGYMLGNYLGIGIYHLLMLLQ